MIAITTKYLGPTNVRGSRIKATGNRNSITISYDDSLNSEHAHAKAARALCDKMKWDGKLLGGGTEHGYAWVFANTNLTA